MLRFLDAFSGYHQIAMAEDDILKTSFITHKGTYAYIMMPFGFLNASATYQRMIDKVFEKQIRRNIECYVDDMIVKSSDRSHIRDLRECFQTLHDNKMRVNPSKSTFGVRLKKFLGYLVSRRCIETNPEKIQAILDMKASQSKKEVQKLTGRLAAL